MRADIEKRLAKLEQNAQQDQQRITKIVLTAPGWHESKGVVIFDWSEQSKPDEVEMVDRIQDGERELGHYWTKGGADMALTYDDGSTERR